MLEETDHVFHRATGSSEHHSGNPCRIVRTAKKIRQLEERVIHGVIMVAFDDKSSLAYRVVAVDISRALGIICREMAGDPERSDSCLEQTKRMNSR